MTSAIRKGATCLPKASGQPHPATTLDLSSVGAVWLERYLNALSVWSLSDSVKTDHAAESRAASRELRVIVKKTLAGDRSRHVHEAVDPGSVGLLCPDSLFDELVGRNEWLRWLPIKKWKRSMTLLDAAQWADDRALSIRLARLGWPASRYNGKTIPAVSWLMNRDVEGVAIALAQGWKPWAPVQIGGTSIPLVKWIDRLSESTESSRREEEAIWSFMVERDEWRSEIEHALDTASSIPGWMLQRMAAHRITPNRRQWDRRS